MCGSGRFRYLSPAGEVLRRGRVLGFAYPSPASHPSDLGPITSPLFSINCGLIIVLVSMGVCKGAERVNNTSHIERRPVCCKSPINVSCNCGEW